MSPVWSISQRRIRVGRTLLFMQPLRKDEVFAGLDPRGPEDSMELTTPETTFNTFGGLLLASALGLYTWAALLLALRWIF